MSPIGIDVTTIRPRHFRWDLAGRVATVTLNRPERKNPLTFESYGELTETFRVLSYVTDVRAVVKKLPVLFVKPRWAFSKFEQSCRLTLHHCGI